MVNLPVRTTLKKYSSPVGGPAISSPYPGNTGTVGGPALQSPYPGNTGSVGGPALYGTPYSGAGSIGGPALQGGISDIPAAPRVGGSHDAPRAYMGSDYLFVPTAGNQNHINKAAGIKPAPTAPVQDQTPTDTSAVVDQFGRTLQDYLPLAQQYMSTNLQAVLNNYAAQQAALQAAQQNGDKNLQAMYAALNAATTNANQADTARYASAQQQSQQATQNALNAVNASNQSFQDQQGKQLAALGIGISGQQAQNQGDYAKMNNSGIGTVGNAATQQMIQAGNSQGDYGRSLLSAGDFAGAQNRAQLQQALMSALSKIQGDIISAQTTNNDKAFSLASDLYNSDYNAFKDNRNYNTNLDNTAFDRAYKQQQLQQQSDYQNSLTASRATGGAAAVQSLVASGITDPAMQSYIMSKINAGAGKSNLTGASNYSQAYSILAADPALNADPAVLNAAAQAAAAAYGGYKG